jgi:hypothetical protein
VSVASGRKPASSRIFWLSAACAAASAPLSRPFFASEDVEQRRVLEERGHAGEGDVRLRHRDAVDQAAPVLLGRGERGIGAVGDARGDDEGVLGREGSALAAVEDVKRKIDGGQRIAAPVFFRVALRVGVLHRDAVGELAQVARALGVGERRGKERVVAGLLAQRALAGDPVHRVAGEVVEAGAGALVGVGHRAAALQAPLARSADRAVDAARARRAGGDDAGVLRIEPLGQLHHQRGAVEQGQVLVAGDLAFAQRVLAREVDVRAVEDAVAAGRAHVGERAVVGVDRAAAQLGQRRALGVAHGRRLRQAEPAFAQARGQQVVGAAVVARVQDLVRGEIGCAGAARGEKQDHRKSEAHCFLPFVSIRAAAAAWAGGR